MGQALTVATVRITAHVHSTEDVGRVKLVVGKLIPATTSDDLEKLVKITPVGGDYGNQIKVISCVLEHKARIGLFLKQLGFTIPESHKAFLNNILEKVYDPESNTMFLRFHKQLLCKDEFCISFHDDIVHVTIKFTSFGSHKPAVQDERKPSSIELGNGVNRVRDFLLERGILI